MIRKLGSHFVKLPNLQKFFYDSGRTDETVKSPDRGLTTTGPGQIGSGVPSVS